MKFSCFNITFVFKSCWFYHYYYFYPESLHSFCFTVYLRYLFLATSLHVPCRPDADFLLRWLCLSISIYSYSLALQSLCLLQSIFCFCFLLSTPICLLLPTNLLSILSLLAAFFLCISSAFCASVLYFLLLLLLFICSSFCNLLSS